MGGECLVIIGSYLTLRDPLDDNMNTPVLLLLAISGTVRWACMALRICRDGCCAGRCCCRRLHALTTPVTPSRRR